MKIEELRAVVAAMTDAPWEIWTSNSFRRITGPNGRDGGVLSGTVQRHDGHPDLAATPVDLAGIVALRNIAPALLDLWEAALRWRDRRHLSTGGLALAVERALSELERVP